MESSVVDPPAVASAPARADLPTWFATLGRRLDALSARRTAPAQLVVGLMLVSLLWRLDGINFHYWIDESISIGIASHPLSQLHGLLRHDGAPPLYYLLLHVWMQLFGHGPVATHVLSLIAAQLCIPAAWWAAAPFGRRVAVFATVLAAGVPFLSSYGEETRMYALMALWSFGVVGCFMRAYLLRRRAWVGGFSLSLLLCLYTHNWGLFLGVACTVAIAVCAWTAPESERRGIIRDGILGLGVVALLYLPWLPTLLFQAGHTGAPWAARTTLWNWTQALYFIVGGRDSAIAIFMGAIAGLIAAYTAAPRRGRFRRELWLGAILVWVTFGQGWVFGKLSPSFAPRYEAAIIGPLAILAAIVLARGRRMAILGVAVAAAWWLTNPVPSSLSAKSNVAAIARVTRPLLDRDTLMLSTQPEQVPTLHYYMPYLRRFATPVGVPANDFAVDWVNLLGRMQHTHGELHRLLGTVTHGQTVALVVPINLPTTTTYLKLINADSTAWVDYLRADRALREIADTKRSWKGSGGAVEEYVFRVL